MEKKELSVFATGNANDMFAQYFVGQSYLNMLSTEQVVVGNVTFESGLLYMEPRKFRFCLSWKYL